MVFTRAQWKYVEENRIVVSALPDQMRLIETISTSSALPPRFDYGDANGQEEVEEILQDHPLHPH
jgi:hypothetical protein